jgi:hypothetical protein
MNGNDPDLDKLEQRLKQLLDEDVAHTDGHARSRLARARYAAVEEARAGRSSFWRALASSSRGFLPAGAVAAAVLVAMLVLTDRSPTPSPPQASAPSASLEELELLVDGEALELLEDWDDTGFYEWAAAQGEGAETSG